MLCAEHGPEADSTPSPKGVDKFLRGGGGGGGGGGAVRFRPDTKSGGGGGGGGGAVRFRPDTKSGGWVGVCCTLQAQYEAEEGEVPYMKGIY